MVYKPSKHYLDRAEEARAISETMQNAATRFTWENIAKGYEALAAYVDRKNYDLERQTFAALQATHGGRNALADRQEQQEVKRDGRGRVG